MTACRVVIVGAGPAGSALAFCLARRGFHASLLDHHERPARRVGESLPGVVHVALRELGLWDSFSAQNHLRTHLLRSAWGSPQVFERLAIQRQYGVDLHVDRADFDAWLAECAVSAGAALLRPVRVEGVATDSRRESFEVRLRLGKERKVLQADFLIDATGRSAWLARRLGARRRRVDRLVAMTRWLRPRSATPFVLVETAESGWWYSSPVPGNECVASWVTDASSPFARVARWEAALSQAPLTRARLEDAEPIGRASICDAAPAVTNWNRIERWLPVGDAAAAFDPVAGNGLVFALRSALEATAALERWRAGDASLLAAYRDGVERVFADHLRERAFSYASEHRWPKSTFWARPRTFGVSSDALW